MEHKLYGSKSTKEYALGLIERIKQPKQSIQSIPELISPKLFRPKFIKIRFRMNLALTNNHVVGR